jgi:hypothetical protein
LPNESWRTTSVMAECGPKGISLRRSCVPARHSYLGERGRSPCAEDRRRVLIAELVCQSSSDVLKTIAKLRLTLPPGVADGQRPDRRRAQKNRGRQHDPPWCSVCRPPWKEGRSIMSKLSALQLSSCLPYMQSIRYISRGAKCSPAGIFPGGAGWSIVPENLYRNETRVGTILSPPRKRGSRKATARVDSRSLENTVSRASCPRFEAGPPSTQFGEAPSGHFRPLQADRRSVNGCAGMTRAGTIAGPSSGRQLYRDSARLSRMALAKGWTASGPVAVTVSPSFSTGLPV